MKKDEVAGQGRNILSIDSDIRTNDSGSQGWGEKSSPFNWKQGRKYIQFKS